MNELKREYWSETLVCNTGKVKIDRREIAAIVENGYLDIHLKSGSIFTVKQGHWDVNTIANLYLTESPHEEVKRLLKRLEVIEDVINDELRVSRPLAFDYIHDAIEKKLEEIEENVVS